MAKLYVTKRIPGLDRLDSHEVAVWEGDGPVPRATLERAIADVDGLLCMLTDRIDRALLDMAPGLEVVSQMAVGVDNIDLDACRSKEIAVGHTPDVLTETVADTAFALLGSIVRRLPEGEREVRAGEWGPWEMFHLAGGDLHGSVLGIVGMGRIGQALARRAMGFDMEVVYTSPTPKDIDARRMELPDLLEISDHVVLCAPLTEATRGLIGERELVLMKESAYLVNVARGPLVDTDALVAALQRGDIAGAALDVTDPEPLPGDHPLLDLDNCLVVPHIGSASLATRHAMAELAIDNLIAFLDGHPMPARHPGGG